MDAIHTHTQYTIYYKTVNVNYVILNGDFVSNSGRNQNFFSFFETV